MNRRYELLTGLLAAAGLAFLILDSKTALMGAQDGVMLCVRTLVPTLFPFFFLSNILSAALIGRRIAILRPIGRLCRIPEGSEYILLAGLLGGYPVGAQSISNAYDKGALSRRDARKMLAFCNNCGPAFLFGMSAALFENAWVPWVLLAVHIVSALLVAIIIPGTPGPCSIPSSAGLSPIRALNQAMRSMAAVCGWVVLFKIMLTFLDRWLFWYFPTEIQAAVSGFLELSNGCISLSTIANQKLRFILCAAFLGFGGLCVTMQTFFAAGRVDKELYFPGKVLQCCISATLACMICGTVYFIIPTVMSVILSILLIKAEKRCRNPQTVVV